MSEERGSTTAGALRGIPATAGGADSEGTLEAPEARSMVTIAGATPESARSIAQHGTLPTAVAPVVVPLSAPSLSPAAQSGAGSTATRAPTIGSPLEALARDEILRTRRFCIIAGSLGVATFCSIGLLPPVHPYTVVLLVVAIAVSEAGLVLLYKRAGEISGFHRPSTALGFLLPTFGVTLAMPYFGTFSPAPVILTLVVYFMGFARSPRLAGAAYAICSTGQLVFSVLEMTGVTTDTGLVHTSLLPARAAWIVQGQVQLVLLATFLTARMSRRTALAAVGELESAVRVAAHRQALLVEAREELERALRAGRGRFTDQVIGGYELGQVIGRGAMGEVYAATDPRTGGLVAIKLLSMSSLGNPDHIRRFLRELVTASNVRSPHVVRIFEVGEHPLPFIVMEKLEGQSLGDLLRGGRALRDDQLVALVREVGAGIDAASATGIIHRDIKPQNLFLDRRTAGATGARASSTGAFLASELVGADGTWKILDFGVARLQDQSDTLSVGQIVGTPSYMSPEQARGAAVDARTDVYGLAAVAYRAITGYPPFSAGEIAEALYRVVHTSPRRPTAIVKVHEDIDLVLAIGLAKDSAARFTTATEFADAFALAVAGDLPAPLRERARALERAGAWSRGAEQL